MIQTKLYAASVDCLKDPVLYQRALALLPAQRRQSAERMKVESGRQLSAGAGLLLLAALADQAVGDGQRAADHAAQSRRGIAAYRDLVIEKKEHGKPYLPEYPQVHFNLSHSGSLVLCMLSPAACGCDVEKIEHDERQIGMVIRCLAESEQRLAAQSPVSFCRIWTLKESILKLSGEGLLIPMNSFEVYLDPPAVRQDFIKGPVYLKEYSDGSGKSPEAGAGLPAGGERGAAGLSSERYCVSCAIAGQEPPEEITQVDLRALLGESCAP